MYSLPTRPETIGKVLDHSFKLFKYSFMTVIVLSLIGATILSLPNLLVPDLGSQDPTIAMQALSQYFQLFIPFLFVGMCLYNAILYRIDATVDNPGTGVGAAMKVGVKKLIPVIVAIILYMIAVMLGMILLIVPGIILMLSLFFYQPLIVLDNEGIIGSLKKSHRLVWGNWWRTAAVFVVPTIIVMVIYIALGFVAGAVGDFSKLTTGTGWVVVVQALISAVTTPLFYSVILVQLNDLKLRKEGGDLEARIAS